MSMYKSIDTETMFSIIGIKERNKENDRLLSYDTTDEHIALAFPRCLVVW